MKYKVGDKVLVRKDLEYDKYYSDVRFDKDMEKCRGGQATITEVYEKFKTYRIDLDRERFMWGDDMFEGKVIPIRVGVSKGKVDIKTEEPLQEKVAEMFGCQLKKIPQDDAVSHPSHYTDGRIEVIDFIQDKKLDFARGNVVKYICRAGKKGGSKAKEIEDLKKAKQYCEFAIRDLEGRV